MLLVACYRSAAAQLVARPFASSQFKSLAHHLIKVAIGRLLACRRDVATVTQPSGAIRRSAWSGCRHGSRRGAGSGTGKVLWRQDLARSSMKIEYSAEYSLRHAWRRPIVTTFAPRSVHEHSHYPQKASRRSRPAGFAVPRWRLSSFSRSIARKCDSGGQLVMIDLRLSPSMVASRGLEEAGTAVIRRVCQPGVCR